MPRTPKSLVTKTLPFLLTSAQRSELGQARRVALRGAKFTKYTVERPVYRLGEGRARRLARWEYIEAAIRSLLWDLQKQGPMPSIDNDRARVAVALIDDNIRRRRS